MRIGDRVRMTEGPFLGIQGSIVSSLPCRIVLSVVLGSREVQIEIERDWIVAATLRRRSISRIETPELSQRATG